ncbi:hypothetical protein [Alkalimonas amylolytica]|uniref:hypothetical protein n=1 Tax=Alkalimonas amylolytica TaxID=152573 RepID=UPI001114AD52|nr:hypothetical protein [Alkalimonas amylolytica]
MLKNIERTIATLDELSRRTGIPQDLKQKILKSTAWLTSQASWLKNTTTVSNQIINQRFSQIPVELTSILISSGIVKATSTRPSWQLLVGLAVTATLDALGNYIIQEINRNSPPETRDWTIEGWVCGIAGMHRFRCDGDGLMIP